MNIANLQIKGLKKGNPKLQSEDGLMVRFYQTQSTLKNLDVYNKFIKGVEKIIRGSKRYKHYINFLKTEIGLNHCAVFPKITDENAPIDMHHGPILTLYDVCCIITNHLLENDNKITTFQIAKIVMDEHYIHNVQVVMLCETAHKLVHASEIYINPKQAWGHLDRFLDKYVDGIDDNMRNIIIKNLELAKHYHSTDRGILDLNEKVKNWDE